MKKYFVSLVIITGFTLGAFNCKSPDKKQDHRRPNILFAIADDQSFPHASAYGMKVFQTPAFDKVADSGILFTRAFVAAPQCSPSRAAILTGRNIWQLEEAGTHSSYFPKKYPVFTDVLETSGYQIGYTGKAWGPGNWKDAGWTRNPVGIEYNDVRFEEVPYSGISKINYAGNFQSFLEKKPADKPFFFWFGAQEPHRNYQYGSGRLAGLDPAGLKVPGFLPSNDSIITDLLDYALEISWFDQQLEKMIAMLEQSGELANTIIVVTADNGMPFPHAKANLQEYGIHVPLAICGPSIRGGRKVDDLVSLIDLAPTFLELAGTALSEGISGKSLVPLLTSQHSGTIDTTRNFILSGRERHTHARPDNTGYPARALRNQNYLYIKNFKPDRWPAGDPPPKDQDKKVLGPDMKAIVLGYEDIDDSPTKEIMLRGKNTWPEQFQAAFAKRPAEELYDIQTDPLCMHDLSEDPRYTNVMGDLRRQLEQLLAGQEDPRMGDHGDVFDSYPRFGMMRPFDGFSRRGEYNPAFDKK